MMVTLFGLAAAPAAVPMLLGLISRKVTNLSAILGFVVGIGAGIGLFFLSRYGQDVQFLGMLWDHGREELVLGSLAVKMEILLFLGTVCVTTLVMFVVSTLAPANAADQARTDAFLERLRTPIGELPEDKRAAPSEGDASPFRVIGVSILLIGLLMLAVLPWTGGGTVFLLDALLGLALLSAGSLVIWASRR